MKDGRNEAQGRVFVPLVTLASTQPCFAGSWHCSAHQAVAEAVCLDLLPARLPGARTLRFVFVVQALSQSSTTARNNRHHGDDSIKRPSAVSLLLWHNRGATRLLLELSPLLVSRCAWRFALPIWRAVDPGSKPPTAGRLLIVSATSSSPGAVSARDTIAGFINITERWAVSSHILHRSPRPASTRPLDSKNFYDEARAFHPKHEAFSDDGASSAQSTQRFKCRFQYNLSFSTKFFTNQSAGFCINHVSN